MITLHNAMQIFIIIWPGSSSCNTIAGPRINENCVFPFVFLEKTYNKCTWEGDSSEGAWCSTKVDEFGTHIKGEWGNCAEQCPVEGIAKI